MTNALKNGVSFTAIAIASVISGARLTDVVKVTTGYLFIKYALDKMTEVDVETESAHDK